MLPPLTRTKMDYAQHLALFSKVAPRPTNDAVKYAMQLSTWPIENLFVKPFFLCDDTISNSDYKTTRGTTIPKWAVKRPWSEVLAASAGNTTKILSQGIRPPGLGFGPFREQSKVPTLRPLSTPKERHLRIPPHSRFCLLHRLSSTCVRNTPSVVRWTRPVSITVINILELLGCVKGGDETIKTTKCR